MSRENLSTLGSLATYKIAETQKYKLIGQIRTSSNGKIKVEQTGLYQLNKLDLQLDQEQKKLTLLFSSIIIRL